MGRETQYDINATIYGSPDYKAILGLLTMFSGVVALINPDGTEHYIYPTAAGLSAGNKTLMSAGTQGTNLVAGPINTGPFLNNLRSSGINILGSTRMSELVTIGGMGIRGAIGFLTGASPNPRLLYFTDAHVPQLGSGANWLAGTGGTVLGAALAGPFSQPDIPRDAVTNLTGPVVIAGRDDKPSALGLIVGDGMTATMVWTVNGTALVAGSPADYALL
jgi:hypothetical protein